MIPADALTVLQEMRATLNTERGTVRRRNLDWPEQVAALDTAIAAVKGQTWQPIETAPKDGRQVQLFYLNPGGISEIGMWRNEIRLGRGDIRKGWRYLRSHSARYDLDHQPTHWMPLPSPPEARALFPQEPT